MSDSKPSDLYEFATAPGATLAPSADDKASGFANGQQPPARWHNWLFNGAHRWFVYLSRLHEEVQFLNKPYAWTGDHTFAEDVTVAGTIRQGTKFVTKMVPTTSFRFFAGPGNLAEDDYPGIRAYNGAVRAFTYLDLPFGATLMAVRCGVLSSSLGSAKISVAVDRVTFDKIPPYAGNSQGSDATDTTSASGTRDVLVVSAISAAVDATSLIRVEVRFNPDATFADPDILEWVDITYSTDHVDPNS